MVGLKYSGKKVPFVFRNENLECRKIGWNTKHQVVEVPRIDAEFMVASSPNDFELIETGEPEEAQAVIVKEEPVEVPEDEPVKPRCGELRSNGEPCKAYAMDNGKCYRHGGKNTSETEDIAPGLVGQYAERPDFQI